MSVQCELITLQLKHFFSYRMICFRRYAILYSYKMAFWTVRYRMRAHEFSFRTVTYSPFHLHRKWMSAVDVSGSSLLKVETLRWFTHPSVRSNIILLLERLPRAEYSVVVLALNVMKDSHFPGSSEQTTPSCQRGSAVLSECDYETADRSTAHWAMFWKFSCLRSPIISSLWSILYVLRHHQSIFFS